MNLIGYFYYFFFLFYNTISIKNLKKKKTKNENNYLRLHSTKCSIKGEDFFKKNTNNTEIN